jgi:hypothetical protein
VTDRHPTSTAALERALAAAEAHEPRVRAWVTIDRDGAREAAQVLDAGPDRPLRGVVLGVKDVLDTAALPTACGSPIYAGFRPRADAAAVALLRDAGALCLGKTVTAELALVTPGPTTNPHRATHTPGGSSMGSAAALATGMADLALGTQTSRPSFCSSWVRRSSTNQMSRGPFTLGTMITSMLAPAPETTSMMSPWHHGVCTPLHRGAPVEVVEPGDDVGVRALLRRRRDRVLEVEEHEVGVARRCLGDHLGARGRGRQLGAAEPLGSGHRYPSWCRRPPERMRVVIGDGLVGGRSGLGVADRAQHRWDTAKVGIPRVALGGER